MARPLSKLAPGWWDYTTLDEELLNDAAELTVKDLKQLQRPGFEVRFYDTREVFYAAQALEYIEAWKQSTPDNPAGICGPVGPIEQLPLVALMVNALGIDLKKHAAHFWGMDEWVQEGKPVDATHPLSFARCDDELCFNRILPELALPEQNKHFPINDLEAYSRTYDSVRCVVMQGGQGDIKHWAFNDPFERVGEYEAAPPTPEEYRQLGTRMVKLHPGTIVQNARASCEGNIAMVPSQASTVGPLETWKAEKVSIWHPGCHDNLPGILLTSLMIARHIVDTAVPMSLLADHPQVQFNYLLPGLGLDAGGKS